MKLPKFYNFSLFQINLISIIYEFNINLITRNKKKMKMKINKKKMKMKKKSKKKMTNKIIHNVFLDIGFKPFSERLDYQENEIFNFERIWRDIYGFRYYNKNTFIY